MQDKIKVNVIAGSGSYHGPGGWLFSDITNIMMNGINKDRFELTITENIDENKFYDVYHYFHSTLAILNKNKMMHRAIVSIQEMSDFAPNLSFEYKEKSFQMAKIVTSPSTSITYTLCKRGIDENKIKYTPLGVDIDKFEPTTLDEKNKILSKYNLKNDVIRFGIISKRYETGRKGEDFLSEIINNFNDTEKFRFMFVGKGWKEYITNNVANKYNSELFEFFEREENCNYEDYPELYGAMDAVLVSSKVDAGPVCILESLSKGIPVISTPTGLASELLVKRVNNEKIGQVIPYGDVYGFVDAIENLVINNIEKVRSEEYKNTIRKVIFNPFRYNPVNKYSVENRYQGYTWENFCKRFEDLYQQVYDDCKDKIFLEDLLNNDTQNKFTSLYSNQATNNLTNVYLENYQQIKNYAKSGVGITDFKNILKDKPTVIVGAGPSLNGNIDLLKKYNDKINIFTCDAALPVLNKYDIKPDVVIVADPSDRQVQNFANCNGKEFITILPTIVHPMTFNEARKHDCTILWYNVADASIELCKWIPKEIGYKGMVIPAVLTSGMVYQIALYMGCNPITFIGHDLCWYDINYGYAEGVSQEKILYQRNNKMFNQPVFLFYDVNGNVVTTDLSFINFVQWINIFLNEYNKEVYNSTGGGILYGNRINQIDFNEWCEKYQFNKSSFQLLYNTYYNIKMGNDITIIPE